MTATRRCLLAAASLGVLASAVASAHAQDTYPSKVITIIVPAAAGGPTDAVARLLAESMTRTLGQTVIVDNAGGAGGTIGMAKVARARPDGYTIAVWHIAQATAPALYTNLTYNVVNDFDHIGRITDVPMTLVSKPDLPPNNIGELLEWIKSSKSKITIGHAGVGSASHLCNMMLESQLKKEMAGVAYRGTGPAMNDLLAGQIEIMCDQTTNTTNHIKSGKIKGFAVTTKVPVSSLPELPTLDKSGLPGFEASAWHAMWAPKGLPQPVAAKLADALKAALKDPKVVERFASLGTEPVAPALVSPDALKSHLTAEVAKWGAIIKAAGVTAN
ncbi:MAG TPA: tripartite tricarboxylate transporter substrate-binding protein [Vineibacter sp.]|nr:tripartite tricarboxylate transporter substrate-binding protein [Vineibacter sp.]